MHLVLGHSQDACCADVLDQLRTRGMRARLVPAPLEPPGRLFWHLDSKGLTTHLALDDQVKELQKQNKR